MYNDLVAAHFEHLKANATHSNRFIDAKLQYWNIVVGAFTAQISSTMTTIRPEKIGEKVITIKIVVCRKSKIPRMVEISKDIFLTNDVFAL